MIEIKRLLRNIQNYGEIRSTRTGDVNSLWNETLSWRMSNGGFPAVTAKTLAWKSVVGELLWFLSGSVCLSDLQKFTFGEDCPRNKWTIWTDDTVRWNKSKGVFDTSPDYVGNLYPVQWRNYGAAGSPNGGVDQIAKLVKGLKENPYNRDHIVMAWNPLDIDRDSMALKPCHIGFQCYVTNEGELNLKWWQRSVDAYLGLPFNIASYALLLHFLCEWAGLRPGILSCDLGDVHIYKNHSDAVEEYLSSPCHMLPSLKLPEKAKSLETVLELTALDFSDSLVGYVSSGVIKAPLSVGI
jgi:thymidylate synthase